MSKKQFIIDSYYNQLIKDIELLKTYSSVFMYPSNDEIKEFLENNIVNRGRLGYQLQSSRDFVRFYLELKDFNKIRYHLLGRLIGYKNLKVYCYDKLYNEIIKIVKAN